ncbi:MAG: diaminopimelate epimerase [Thermodesulfobacteriota bacterium]
MNFTKMHGLGNDFILIDCLKMDIPIPSDTAKKVCHRKFGIGADQLLLLYPSEVADFRMVIFNADGSEAEMCGNGIRCMGKYLVDRGIASKIDLEIETKAGIIKVRVREDLVEVDMGVPYLEGVDIPVNLDGRIVSHPIMIDDREFKITCVSMGNPHCVIFLKDVAGFPVAAYGPKVETHPLFPARVNVEFAQVIDERNIRIRVWERGAGETLACGTGACATLVAAILNGLTHRRVTLHLKGGNLDALWGEDDRVYMTGPAVEVYNGTIE